MELKEKSSSEFAVVTDVGQVNNNNSSKKNNKNMADKSSAPSCSSAASDGSQFSQYERTAASRTADRGSNGDCSSGSVSGSTSSQSQSSQHGSRSDVCRDFLRNVCSRGQRCKYFHPADADCFREYGESERGRLLQVKNKQKYL